MIDYVSTICICIAVLDVDVVIDTETKKRTTVSPQDVYFCLSTRKFIKQGKVLLGIDNQIANLYV